WRCRGSDQPTSHVVHGHGHGKRLAASNLILQSIRVVTTLPEIRGQVLGQEGSFRELSRSEAHDGRDEHEDGRMNSQDAVKVHLEGKPTDTHGSLILTGNQDVAAASNRLEVPRLSRVIPELLAQP